MNKRVSLGQYFPADSPLHSLDPRIKIILTIFYIVSIFMVDSFWAYIFFFAMIVLLVPLGKLPAKRLIKGLRPILMVLAFSFLLNALVTPGKVIFSWAFIKITEEGLIRGIFISIRLILLVLGTTLLTLTTSPMQLTDGLESLMSPLKIINFPAQILAMMISIALRFIPTLYEEADKIMKAQKARGADFESGNMFKRAKAMIPLLVPLFINSLNRAEELGIAMEARCYNGGRERTRLNPLKLRSLDIGALLSMSLVFSALAYFF